MARLETILSLGALAVGYGIPSTVPREVCAHIAAEDESLALLQESMAFRGQSNLHVLAPQDGADKLAMFLQDAVQHLAHDAPVTFSAALAEYIAMTLFVTIGCGCAMGIAKEPGSAWILQVSLTFGFAITSLAYAVGAYSGGQINCAVTLGLVLVGKVSIGQGILNFIAQMLGSLTGAYILCAIFPKDQDRTGGLGANGIGEGWSTANAFVGEVLMTFLLMFVVLETAVNENSEANRAVACLAIGFAVFLAHTVLIPIDGCSINPTRSFGPAFVAKQRYGKADTMRDMGVFFAAPCTGAALAAAAYGILRAV